MSTARRLLLGAAGIAALAVACLAILLALEEPARRDTGAPETAPSPPRPPAAVPAVAPASAAAPQPLPEVTAPRIGARPSAAATVGWDDVPIAAKPSDLGPGLARPAFDAVRAARAQMDTCFAEEGARAANAPEAEGHVGPAVLLLHLQSREGGLDVVGTEVESRGDSSPELVRCARDVLQGWPIGAPGAAPGRRYRLKLVLR